MKAYDKLVDNCRALAIIYQFNPEPFLLLQASLAAGGTKASHAWQGKTFQRFFHRQIRDHDELIRGVEATYFPRNARWVLKYRPGLSRARGDVDEYEDRRERNGEGEGEEGAEDDYDLSLIHI